MNWHLASESMAEWVQGWMLVRFRTDLTPEEQRELGMPLVLRYGVVRAGWLRQCGLVYVTHWVPVDVPKGELQ